MCLLEKIVTTFVFGLAFGSFFNSCIYRIPRHISVAWPASACTECGIRLSPLELVPVLSVMWQGGRCRHCHARIPWTYPLVELATGVLFAATVARHGVSAETFRDLALVSLLVVVTGIDLEHYVIPNSVLLVGAAASIPLVLLAPAGGWWAAPVGGAVGGLIMAIIVLASRGGMGAGEEIKRNG